MMPAHLVPRLRESWPRPGYFQVPRGGRAASSAAPGVQSRAWHGLARAALAGGRSVELRPIGDLTLCRPLLGNIRSGVYDTFFALYGIDIAKDIIGMPRPQGARAERADRPRAPSARLARSPPILSRFALLEVSYLDERRLGLMALDEDDSCAPARVRAQESTGTLGARARDRRYG